MPEIPRFSCALRMAIEGLGASRVAERSKLPLATLRKFLAGKSTLTTAEIDRLQPVLDLDLNWFIEPQ